MRDLSGTGQVYRFTLSQLLKSRANRVTLIIMVLLAAVIWGLLTLASRVYAGLIVHRGSRVKLRELMSMAKGGAVR